MTKRVVLLMNMGLPVDGSVVQQNRKGECFGEVFDAPLPARPGAGRG